MIAPVQSYKRLQRFHGSSLEFKFLSPVPDLPAQFYSRFDSRLFVPHTRYHDGGASLCTVHPGHSGKIGGTPDPRNFLQFRYHGDYFFSKTGFRHHIFPRHHKWKPDKLRPWFLFLLDRFHQQFCRPYTGFLNVDVGRSPVSIDNVGQSRKRIRIICVKIQRQRNGNSGPHPFPQHADQKRVSASDEFHLQGSMGRKKDTAHRSIQRKLFQNLSCHSPEILQF